MASTSQDLEHPMRILSPLMLPEVNLNEEEPPNVSRMLSKNVKISSCVLNWVFWIISVPSILVGVYFNSQMAVINSMISVYFSPDICMIVMGILLFCVSCLGYIGVIRENVMILYWYMLTMIILMMSNIPVGTISFVHAAKGNQADSIQKDLWKSFYNYKGDDRVATPIDNFQISLQCCGISAKGYRDWHLNSFYQCNQENPSSLRCGVPPSCCKFDKTQTPQVYKAIAQEPPKIEGKIVSARFSTMPIFPLRKKDAHVKKFNSMCGYGVLNHTLMTMEEIESAINTKGCIAVVVNLQYSASICLGCVSFCTAFLLLIAIVLACKMAKSLPSAEAFEMQPTQSMLLNDRTGNRDDNNRINSYLLNDDMIRNDDSMLGVPPTGCFQSTPRLSVAAAARASCCSQEATASTSCSAGWNDRMSWRNKSIRRHPSHRDLEMHGLPDMVFDLDQATN